MNAAGRILAFVAGLALVVLGLVIWIGGDFSWPTRWPPLRFQFAGVPRFALGAAPLLLGGVCCALAAGLWRRESRATLGVSLLGFALVAVAFVLAPKA